MSGAMIRHCRHTLTGSAARLFSRGIHYLHLDAKARHRSHADERFEIELVDSAAHEFCDACLRYAE